MSIFDGPREEVEAIIDHAITKAAESFCVTILPAIVDQASRVDLGELVIEIRVRRKPDA